MIYKHRVAFIVSSLDMGGAQRAVSNIVINLPDDWDIRLILNTDENIVYPYKGEIVSLGISGGGDRKGLIYQARVWFKRYRYVKKMKKNEKFDAVISFLDSANILNLSTGKSGKIIISVRNCISESKSWKYKYIVSPLIRKKYNNADEIIALSEGVRKDLIDNYGIDANKVTTIYNCYNVEDIFRKSRENASVDVDHNIFNVITAGRLCHQKGQWHLIRAFSDVAHMYPNSQLHIFGDGDLKDYLNQLITDLHLEKNVTVHSYVKDLYAVMGKMDLFVFPSLYEGLGNVLLEAMCCGLPCVASDYKYGAREILCDRPNLNESSNETEYADYGILVPVMSSSQNTAEEELEKNEKILAETILTLAADKNLREKYAEKAKERVKSFSPESIISDWEKIILR